MILKSSDVIHHCSISEAALHKAKFGFDARLYFNLGTKKEEPQSIQHLYSHEISQKLDQTKSIQKK